VEESPKERWGRRLKTARASPLAAAIPLTRRNEIPNTISGDPWRSRSLRGERGSRAFRFGSAPLAPEAFFGPSVHPERIHPETFARSLVVEPHLSSVKVPRNSRGSRDASRAPRASSHGGLDADSRPISPSAHLWPSFGPSAELSRNNEDLPDAG